jgi:RND family efflux transporter MFP subunit
MNPIRTVFGSAALLLAALLQATPLQAAPLPTPATPTPAAPAAATGGDTVRGVVRARNTAVLSSRLSAQITRMPLQTGQSFRKGELLVAFDCERQRAEARAAVAAHRAHQKTYEVQHELKTHNAIGGMEVEVTRSQMDKAAADVAALEAGLRECTVLAPYAGRVVETVAQEHEIAGQGQPLLRIQGADDLELQLIVPSRWMAWLRGGTSFTFRIDETGESMTASVLRTGAAVDPVSQTVKITARLPAGKATVLPGMSGTADFKRPGL